MFNTAITGYQEILTDPSYAGQIVTFTFPHIGNVGTNDEDIEALTPYARGMVSRAPITDPSNWRSSGHLDAWLGSARHRRHRRGRHAADHAHPARARARRTRPWPTCPTASSTSTSLKARAKAGPSLEGMDLAGEVSSRQRYGWDETRWAWGEGYGRSDGQGPHVVAIDYGVKRNILRSLASLGCRVTVVPATATADEVLALAPDGVVLTNGPGDPAATGDYAVPEIRKLVDSGKPVFGICLGHQMLGLALGGRTEKMPFGHHGANHPVQDLTTGKVEITSQNHGFAIADGDLPEGVEVTHRSLFDGTIQGIRLKDRPVFSVQYHPEASPGPMDSSYLFDRFLALIAQAA